MSASYEIIWSAPASPSAGGIGIGTVVVISADGATYKPATLANTIGSSVIAGIAISDIGPFSTFTLQQSGVIHSELSGLGAGSKSAVIADPVTARCVRSAVPSVTDILVGTANERGDVLLGASASVGTGGVSLVTPVNPKVSFGATGNGVTNDRPAIVAAAATAAGKTLVFNAGTYLITSDLVIGKDVGIWLEQGAKFDAPGHTITVEGPIFAHPQQQIFTPTTKLRYTSYNRQVNPPSPYWWGAQADFLADDGPALQQWIDSVTSRTWPGGVEMVIPVGSFTTRQQLNMFGSSSSAVKITGTIASYAGRGSAIRHTGTPIASSTNPAAAPVVFTCDRPHGLSTYDRVKITNHTGNTAIPAIGISGQVTLISPTSFSIDGLLGNGGAAGGTSGTAGGAVLQMKGVNNSTFKDVTFDGTGKCNTAVWYRTDQAPTGGGGAGANGMYFYGCAFQGAAGDLSCLLAFGEYSSNTGGNTYQAAEVNCYQCTFTGSGNVSNMETATSACWAMLQGGNVKDNSIKDCNLSGALTLVDSAAASGTFEMRNCEMTTAYRYSILMGGANAAISTCASENANGPNAGGIFLSTLGTGSAGAGMVSMTDCLVVSPVWDQTIGITSVSNVNGVNRVVTCSQLPRFASVGHSVFIDGNSDAAVNGLRAITAVNMALNQFTINVVGTGAADGTGGQYLNKSADGILINYTDKLYLRGNMLDGSDVALTKLGPPTILGGNYPFQLASGGSLVSENNVYRFGHIQVKSYAVSIASSTNTSPITINTSAAHGRYPGDKVCIQEHRVNTAANGIWTVAAVPSTTSLTLTGSVGIAAGGTSGQLVPVSYEGIPVMDSGGACTGRATYAQQPLAISSKGDSAGNQSNNTNFPMQPLNGWTAREGILSPVLTSTAVGVKVQRTGNPTIGTVQVELDYALFQANITSATTARVKLFRLKTNSLMLRMGMAIMTPFTVTGANTLIHVGTSNAAQNDDYLTGGIPGAAGGADVSTATGTVYGHLATDMGTELTGANYVQGGSWASRGSGTVDVYACLVATSVAGLAAGKVRLYFQIDSFLVDYY